MDKTELRAAFQTLGVHTRVYSLSDNQMDERFCLYQQEGWWRVSFFERGQKHVLGSFSTESVACESILEELKHEL